MHKQAGVMYVIRLGVHISVDNVPFQSTVVDFYSNLCTNSATVVFANDQCSPHVETFTILVYIYIIHMCVKSHLNSPVWLIIAFIG